MKKLKFSVGNAKLNRVTAIFDLPAGHTCPFANECKSKAVANKETGKCKIVDGANCQFRCFAATEETRPNVRNARWHNFNLLKGKSVDEMVKLIDFSILAQDLEEMRYFRIHASGDFFNQDYFDAWIKIANMYPEIVFYAYTKSLPYWIARMGQIPSNFVLNASKGGKHDNLIQKHNLKYAEVVLSEEEAELKGLAIDKNDKLAYAHQDSFALLIHGTQPAGTEASKAWQELKKAGKSGYGRKK